MESQSRRIIIFSVMSFAVIVGLVTWAVIFHSQQQLIEFKALKIAEVVAKQSTVARSIYSELAVSKLKDDGYGAHSSPEAMPGFVPLPAQFLKQLSRDSKENSDQLYSFKPLSEWNLAPDQGLQDEFQKWGWNELRKQEQSLPAAPTGPLDWKPVWRIENKGNELTLRYMQADPAVSQSCVDCHNALEQQASVIAQRQASGTPTGHQWQLNELLGALEVNVPLKGAAALAKKQTKTGLLVVFAVTAIGLTGVCLLFFLDSAQSRAMTQKLSLQTRRDSLTGLPNRLALEETLNSLVEQNRDAPQSHAVMFLDLNHFKEINDTIGHSVGDAVLKLIGQRLRNCIRETDFVARLGGDEFAIIVVDADRASAERLAQSISTSVIQRFQIGEHNLNSSVSIGIAMLPEHGVDTHELLRCADVAMYVSKREQHAFFYYDKAFDNNDLTNLSLQTDLRQAILTGSLSLHFQPKWDLKLNQMVGAEALLRWVHPEHGNVSPDKIIPIAERNGLMGDLTAWVLNSALAQCAQWHALGYELSVSVNLSATSLQDDRIVKDIETALAKANIQPKYLIVEVTETSVMSDHKQAEKVLFMLGALGVMVSIDDFGTGYSSLSYLNRLPIQELKLDRSFMTTLFNGKKDAVIVKATVDLAHNLNMTIVAEGIEDAKTMDYLRSVNCNIGQGYFLSCPLPAKMFRRKLPELYQLTNTASGQGADKAA